ncbi:hypothetical protein DLAC_02390 [Tieghemostelium lacteum]|uniref:Prostamide/prostaglandin F synthase n=1 Tax=Tieghemostelium lacteum TaxID=361077 RepID=A0A152A598_TIELA|nr:hypothetical protein DLAC_02390 [Tieghemostelium lacteum]|eukprot:KYR01267.1 hypothetical protein DLAC_02390 [Tieghemostelium lacteum]
MKVKNIKNILTEKVKKKQKTGEPTLQQSVNSEHTTNSGVINNPHTPNTDDSSLYNKFTNLTTTTTTNSSPHHKNKESKLKTKKNKKEKKQKSLDYIDKFYSDIPKDQHYPTHHKDSPSYQQAQSDNNTTMTNISSSNKNHSTTNRTTETSTASTSTKNLDSSFSSTNYSDFSYSSVIESRDNTPHMDSRSNNNPNNNNHFDDDTNEWDTSEEDFDEDYDEEYDGEEQSEQDEKRQVRSPLNLYSYLSDKALKTVETKIQLSEQTHGPNVFPLDETLVGIKIVDLNGNRIEFASLWDNRRIVLAVFRRFGCLVCRLQALELSSLKSRFDQMGITLIGIGFDPDGLDEFIEGKFFAGEIYIDKARAVHRALSLKRLGFWDSAVGFTDPRLLAYRKKAKEIGMPSNFKGDGLQLGATIVLGPKPQSAHYDFRQRSFTDLFDINLILQACKTPYPDGFDPYNKFNISAIVQSKQQQSKITNNNILPPPIFIPNATELHFSTPTNNTSDKNQKNVDPLGQLQISQYSPISTTISTTTNTTTTTTTTTSSLSRSAPDLKHALSQSLSPSTSPKYNTFTFDSFYNEYSELDQNTDITNSTTTTTTTATNTINSTNNNIFDQKTEDIEDEISLRIIKRPYGKANKKQYQALSTIDFYDNIKFESIVQQDSQPTLIPSSTYLTSTNSIMKIELEKNIIYNPY